jgi:hypothetical protein
MIFMGSVPLGFVLNPHFRIYRGSVVMLRSPVRKRGLQEWTIGTPSDLSLAEKLSALHRGENLELMDSEWDRLRETGALVRPEEVSASVSYRCELSYELGRSEASSDDTRDMIFNPGLVYATDGRIPPRLAHRVPECEELDLDGGILWTEDPDTRIISPFAVDGEFREGFERAYLHGHGVKSLDPKIAALFFEARVLLRPDHWRREGRAYAERMLQARQDFQKRQCAVFAHDLLNPYQVRALQTYFREIIAEGWVNFPVHGRKRQSDESNRVNLHNEPICSFFHKQMHSVISDIVDEPWQPSYCLFAAYQPGAALARHVDRKQCGLSLSVLIDYVPNRVSGDTWPLHLVSPGGEATELRWNIGEAALFDGRSLVHYRDELRDEHEYTGMFLHFVPPNFDDGLD